MIVFLHVQFETTLELEPGDKTNLDYSNLHLANSNMLYRGCSKKSEDSSIQESFNSDLTLLEIYFCLEQIYANSD